MYSLNFIVIDANDVSWDIDVCLYGDDCFLDVIRSVFEEIVYRPIRHFYSLRAAFFRCCLAAGSYLNVFPKFEYQNDTEYVPVKVTFGEAYYLIARFNRI